MLPYVKNKGVCWKKKRYTDWFLFLGVLNFSLAALWKEAINKCTAGKKIAVQPVLWVRLPRNRTFGNPAKTKFGAPPVAPADFVEAGGRPSLGVCFLPLSQLPDDELLIIDSQGLCLIHITVGRFSEFMRMLTYEPDPHTWAGSVFLQPPET